MGLSRAATRGLTLMTLLPSACAVPAAGPARFAPAACGVVRVVDSETGTALAGIEDVALHRGRLILSAHDRLAERRAKAGEALPEGGLWTIPMDALLAGETRADRLLPEGTAGGLRPHGISVADDRLAVVNRPMRKGDRPAILEFDLGESEARLVAVHRVQGRALDPCGLNGVAFRADAILATLHLERCPSSLLGQLAVAADSGRLISIANDRTTVLAEGLHFANGIEVLEGGVVAVAETRASRVRLSNRDEPLALPGGPDNLTLAADGRLVAAVFPSLWRTGLHLFGWRATAPARVVALDPETGAVELLFDDPQGELLPGISVGLLVNGALVGGAVRAEGLLLCR
jgi:arylesterase/paraoxonase